MKTYACYPNGGVLRRSPAFRYAGPYYQYTHNPAFAETSVKKQPAANILREKDVYRIELALPGFSKEQIKLEVQDNALTVIASAGSSADNTGKQIREEFNFTESKRTFRLHKNADTEKISANFHEGILTIVIPDKTPENITLSIQ